MTTQTTKLEKLISYTNQKLLDWYANVEMDYGIVGNGFAQVGGTDEIEIFYEESGTKCLFTHYYHEDFRINTVFDIWSVQADPDLDSAKYQEHLSR